MKRKTGVARVLLSAGLMAAMISAVAPTAATAAPTACTWTPAFLPLPAGGLFGEVVAADGSGGYAGTVGYSTDYRNKDTHAVAWKNGKPTDYGYLDDPGYKKVVEVAGVNDSGTIVGIARRTDDGFNAVRSRNGRIERLPELPGAVYSNPKGINNKGDIVGNVGVVGADKILYFHPVLWPADQPGTVLELTDLPGPSPIVEGLDQDGTVLFTVNTETGPAPYLWQDGTARALPLPAGVKTATMRGISNGRVVANIPFGQMSGTQSLLWDRDGRPQAVPQSIDVRGINRDGRIVGRVDVAPWRSVGVWQLTTLGATLNWAADWQFEIVVASDDGTIAGGSWNYPVGFERPTVWTCR
ncbi:hypothetical protein [Embleya sp. AB8]|uniref:hypothetical protein n=1 Tax=Embleya sp. AB8 TaxID=3156304 RepID=UPI003C76DBDE